MKITILRDLAMGNPSVDAIDNLVEAEFAQRYLSAKHQVSQMGFLPDLEADSRRLAELQPDLVFNLVETVCNKESLSVTAVQLLDALGIPYTGCTLYAQMVTADKMLTKQILRNNGIASPSDAFIAGANFLLKARTEHASASLDDSCVQSFATAEALQQALRRKEEQTSLSWFAEEYIDGREFSCAFLGDEILPPAEFVFDKNYRGHKIITYQAKWNEETPEYKLHWRDYNLEGKLASRIRELTDRCRKALFMKGYARVDFRMDNSGNLYVIDINTNPCISPDSSFIDMAKQGNWSIEQLFDKIVDNAFLP